MDREPRSRRGARRWVALALFAGLAAGIPFLIWHTDNQLATWLLVPGWMVLYGCAVHSAGFFMPRGMKLFGWAYIIIACGLAMVGINNAERPMIEISNWTMGVCFGGGHFIYGIYLYFTEKSRNSA